MRLFYFFTTLFFGVFILAGMAIMMNPTPLREPIQDQAVRWLTQDRDIHLSFLEKPELPEYAAPYINTGTHAFHKQWADDLTEVINFIDRKPSKYTRAQCIEVLKRAQSTHAGVTNYDYATAKWNYEWFERYDIIINYLKEGDFGQTY